MSPFAELGMSSRADPFFDEQQEEGAGCQEGGCIGQVCHRLRRSSFVDSPHPRHQDDWRAD